MPMKVDDLLRTRGGTADSADAQLLRLFCDDPLPTLVTNEPIKRAVSKAREFEPPNPKTKHTNVNYDILGEVVRYVSGNDPGVPISEGVLEPLVVKASRYPTTGGIPGEPRGDGGNDRTQTLTQI